MKKRPDLICFRVGPAEQAEIKRAARAAGLTLSEWVREILLYGARGGITVERHVTVAAPPSTP